MGGGPSRTRRLTLDNEDPSNVIKVSDDVVQRLRGKQATAGVNNVSPGASWPAVQGGIPMGVPTPYFYIPTLNSLQLRQEKEAELKKNDQYWEKRVKDLEKAHGKMHLIMENEYQKALDEGKSKKTEEIVSCYMPPCQSKKKAVMECYKKYSKEPMRCSKEVEAFAECVDVQRATMIANRG